MKIVFDNIIYSLQRAGGISTYWGALSKCLLRDNVQIQFIEGDDKIENNIVRKSFQIDKIKILREANFSNFIRRFIPVRISNSEEKFIFHSSYNRTTNNINAFKVLTVHDFVHEKFYSGIRKILHSYQKSKAVRTADHIIAISNNTKADILKYFPNLKHENISVVYNGVSEDFYPLDNKDLLLNINHDRPFLLFVGSREHYKNFDFTLELLKELTEFDLYIVGVKLTKFEEEVLNRNISSRWKLFNGIANNDLNILYNNAYALIYPSSYEGFGIPLLEAMRAGTPFIALNKSSIPEVAGDAGILIDDLDAEKFIHAVKSIETKREELLKKGFLQASKFSWDKCYEETLNVYKNLWNQ